MTEKESNLSKESSSGEAKFKPAPENQPTTNIFQMLMAAENSLISWRMSERQHRQLLENAVHAIEGRTQDVALYKHQIQLRAGAGDPVAIVFLAGVYKDIRGWKYVREDSREWVHHSERGNDLRLQDFQMGRKIEEEVARGHQI